jgi:superfamily I DNA/RNA helicase
MKDFRSLEIDYNDFAILLRAGYQSLSIELALQKIGIPCIFRGGHKFFDRQE